MSDSPAGARAGGAVGWAVAGADAGRDVRPETIVARRSSASAIDTGSNCAAPTLAIVGASSIVRRRSICWLKKPLFRSVNWTPAMISTSQSSIAARTPGSLAAPA